MSQPFAKLIVLLTPERRWFQFRLRTLFVLVVVAAVPCAWLAWKIENKRRERAILSEIERLAGDPVYEWQWHLPGRLEVDPPGAAWVRKLLGDDFFTGISDVTSFFPSDEMTDECLAHLEPLTALRFVCLQRSSVTDAGLEHLARIKNLDELMLDGTRVTDAGLIHLERLQGLHTLFLSNTQVSDAGLVHLTKLPQLGQLDLENTNVTDAGVAELQKALPNCLIQR